ncbi:MAG TPA: hypothetical protein VFG23_08070, partial [Polyangia bacterium]|nr:hypothetical protein [Polyangia bacterium]
MAVSVRPESPSGEDAGDAGSTGRELGVKRPDTKPSGAFGAGTPKMVLVALPRAAAATGDGVAEGATPGGVTRAAGVTTTEAG